ncbi:granzyme A-like [Chiloscyllium plagiosum]|uniref:granzyme A-like n=1 Tax=Chiloscyllium plagiosum TaxID=36176 RepID=UPI001CB85D43|nr:granzyme A-like [Chiloscyllium plagiosum]
MLGQDTEAPPVMTIDDHSGTVIDKRIRKAASTLTRLMTRVWTNPKLTAQTKVSVYNACVISTVLQFKYQKVKAVLGTDSLSKKETAQIITVKQKFPHVCFDKQTTENDIMLLQLQSEAELNKYVNLLPLPKHYLDVKDGTVCSVAGWGWTSIKSNKGSDHLKEVNVTTINRSKCNSRQYYNGKPLITKNMLCAGDKRGGKDACREDSGGPMICKNEFRGIVSFGKKCGLAKKPGIYTRLTKEYIEWIQEKTA